MSQESVSENMHHFEIGNSVVYGKRIWKIKNIQGDEVEIYASESSGEITVNSLKGGETNEEVAAQWGGVLQGESYPAISPDGEKFMSQKVFFPEETKKVKLSELSLWSR